MRDDLVKNQVKVSPVFPVYPVFPVSTAGSVDWGDREDWEDLFSRYRGAGVRPQRLQLLVGGARVDGPAGQLDPALPIAGQSCGAQCRAGVGQHNIAARTALALQDRRGNRGILLGTTTGDRLGRSRGEPQVGGGDRVCPHGPIPQLRDARRSHRRTRGGFLHGAGSRPPTARTTWGVRRSSPQCPPPRTCPARADATRGPTPSEKYERRYAAVTSSAHAFELEYGSLPPRGS